jgi:hypothetical protein
MWKTGEAAALPGRCVPTEYLTAPTARDAATTQRNSTWVRPVGQLLGLGVGPPRLHGPRCLRCPFTVAPDSVF